MCNGTTLGIFKTAGQGKLGWKFPPWSFYRKANKLNALAATWPGYISHYLIKLISISTTDFITFLSDKNAVIVGFLTAWMMKLWWSYGRPSISDNRGAPVEVLCVKCTPRSKDQIADGQFGSK